MIDHRRPLVSVITPSLNQGQFIEETILSVMRQDYTSIEHIVIDGGSSDDTLDVLRRYPHLTWVSEPDGGQSDAINKGFARARGDLLSWLNADDTYTPGAVTAAVDFLNAHPQACLVYGDCDQVDEQGRFLERLRGRPFDLRGYLLFDHEVPQPATFFRRRVIDEVGGLDAQLHLAMDFDYWIRVARVCRLEYSGQLWATYRMHPTGKTTARISEALRDHLSILDREFGDPHAPQWLSRMRRRAYSNAYLSGCFRSCERGCLAEARTRLWAALRAYPQPLRAKILKALLYFFDAALGVHVGHGIVRWLRRTWRPRPASHEARCRGAD
jgi:glycosyltransferase involved in cell wall biosynthesis